MPSLRRWVLRLANAFRRGSAETDLAREINAHLELLTDDFARQDMTPAEARRAAQHVLGGVEQTKDLYRDTRSFLWLEDARRDVQYALRGLTRNPGFALVAVLTLALGIGANTALFSVVSAVLLRPLPYPDADRLVRIWTAHPQSGLARGASALPNYRVWRSDNRTLEELGAFHTVTHTLTGTDRPEALSATRMTASLWSVLQGRPLHGRLFLATDEQWGAHRVVVLSERLWRRRFGGDPQLIGRSLQLDGQSFIAIGVMPASFAFPGPLNELWSPIAYAPGDDMDSRGNHFAQLLGRMKPSVTPGEALADLSTVAARLTRDFPQNAGIGVTLEQWQESIVSEIRPTLLFLLGAVAFVLLIACANVANLLLARATTRGHELTVRATIGAGRSRLVRQLLTEHLTLACLGAVAGVLVAYALIRGIPALGPTGMPRLNEVGLDARVIAFAAALALLTGLVFGVWPARHAGRTGGAGHLKESARTIVGGRMQARARQALVTAEVALSLVLLVGATLLIVSLQRLQQVDAGFDADRLFTATLNLPAERYNDAERVARFIHDVVDEVAAIPGIHAADATTTLPLGGNEWGKFLNIDGRPAPLSLAQVPSVSYRQVTPGYLQTMGATLRRGRLFTEKDAPGQPLVAIVNETIARRFWPEGDPIGQRISMTPPESLIPPELFPPGITRLPYRTVVGVIGDFRQNGLEREANPEVFVPVAQMPLGAWQEMYAQEFMSTHVLVARTAGDPLAATGAIQAAVSRLDPSLPVANVRTMESRLSDSMAERRFAMWLLSGFAILALALALVGLYGLIAIAVQQRREELGVRTALGATATRLLRLVMVDGLQMTIIGAGIGLLLATALTRFMASQLFQVEAIEPAVYAGVTVLFVVVASLACFIPAFRATRGDPAASLRCE